jgi:hypothetical protein
VSRRRGNGSDARWRVLQIAEIFLLLFPLQNPSKTKYVKVVFYPISPISEEKKKHCFLEGSQTSPVCSSGTSNMYMGGEKFLARLTSLRILFHGEKISFYASIFSVICSIIIYIYIYIYIYI